MIKLSSLQGKYKGLTDGSAYQLRYEYGENIRALRILVGKLLQSYIQKIGWNIPDGIPTGKIAARTSKLGLNSASHAVIK